MPKMSGQHDGVKAKKRKTGTELRDSRKASGVGRRCLESQRTNSKAEDGSAVRSSRAADPLERLSLIICECHQSAGRRRCSASPDPQCQEEKENDLLVEQESDSCRKSGKWSKQEPECMDCEQASKIIFPDDDSNQILPVEQFFGNMDIVQDLPQKSSATSSSVQSQKRRRHYYALEDDNEDLALSSV